jgi:hypothetical protein
MFQRLKKSLASNKARNKVNYDKMTVLTKAAVGYIFPASLLLWMPFYYWDLLNWFRGEFNNATVWIPYIMLQFTVSIHISRGRGNLGFVVALASVPVQLALGFYQDWDTIFAVDPFSFLEDAQWSFENFGLWLYLSNVLHLIGLVLLVAGRKEWRAKSIR